MTTLNSEFNIRPDNNCYANLHNNYAYNFPSKPQYRKLVNVTSMQEALIEISNWKIVKFMALKNEEIYNHYL